MVAGFSVELAHRNSANKLRTSFLHIAGTDCVAGVVGLELRNPLGSKSAGVARDFRRFGRNGAAETVRVRAAGLPTCSCGKGLAWCCAHVG